MKKRHLFLMMDIVIALALVDLTSYFPYIYPRTLADLWSVRGKALRVLTPMLWLAGLWFNLYQVRDKAQRIDNRTLLSGMVFMLCAMFMDYPTGYLVNGKARIAFQLCGALVLISAAACWAMLKFMEAPNADMEGFRDASRKVRGTLAVAFAIVAAGLVVGSIHPSAIAQPA